MIKQVSIFLENKPSSLDEMTEILTRNNISMKAFSLADTYDFGIARTIVDDAEKTAEILRKNNYVINLTPVLVVEVEDKVGALNETLNVLSKSNQNIEYMYAFTGHKTNKAYMILRTTDIESSEKALKASSLRIIDTEDLAKI